MFIEHTGENVRVHPVSNVNATVRLPGSKSLTNRYLLCAALADGLSRLRAVSISDDALRMIDGLRRLGVQIELREDAEIIEVSGCHGHLPADSADLDLGNAGTAMRFLTALTCLGYGDYRLDGTPRMRQRPIGPLVGALGALGAGIGYEQSDGCPPLTVHARGLTGGDITFATPPSSQYISALLMVAPYAGQDVRMCINGPLPSRPYISMTIDVMRSLGVEVIVGEDFDRFIVPATQRYQAREIAIEPDASAATYFWAAAAITGGRVTVQGLTHDSFQGDTAFARVLERMGCQVEEGDNKITVQGPPVGSLRGIDVDLNAMPDAAQTLAVAALFASGPTHIRNIANLRIKETDRLAALESELLRLGATVEVSDDSLRIEPPAEIRPAAIETYDDHRMVMSFALAGLRAEGIEIKDAACVSKSFPHFFEVLGELAPEGGQP